jgi:hypothetical protein
MLHQIFELPHQNSIENLNNDKSLIFELLRFGRDQEELNEEDL